MNKIQAFLNKISQRFSSQIAFLSQLQTLWTGERVPRMAAALAYYSMFSLAPIIYISLVVAGLFWNELPFKEIFARIEQTVGPEVAEFLAGLVIGASERTTGGTTLTSLIGFLALLYAASGLFVQLKFSLNTIWDVPASESGGMLAFIINRLVAFILVIGIGLIIVGINFANVVISVIDSLIPFANAVPISNAIILFITLYLSFALLYIILPDTKVRWREVWLGALISALAFSIGRWVIGFYLSRSSIGSAFEAAGVLAVLLVAVYYMAQIFLFGAVFAKVYSLRAGERRSE